jgi:hypothetical protein
VTEAVEAVSAFLSISAPALITAAVIVTLLGALIFSGLAARILLYLQELME